MNFDKIINNMLNENIPGGKSQGMTVEDIAKKHNVSVEAVNKQIEMGIKVEMEHTTNKDTAKEIAMDHLSEFKNYYTKLAEMEAILKKQENSPKPKGKYLNTDVKESMTAGGTGSVFTAYAGTVNAGGTGGSVNNQDSWNSGRADLFMGGGKAPSLKPNKKPKRNGVLTPIMPVQKRKFAKM